MSSILPLLPPIGLPALLSTWWSFKEVGASDDDDIGHKKNIGWEQTILTQTYRESYGENQEISNEHDSQP